MRSLAERSKDSTSQVRSILQDIESAGRDALAVIEEGSRRAEIGTGRHAAGESIQLSTTPSPISTAAMQIAASTRQQSVGVEADLASDQGDRSIANETRQRDSAARVGGLGNMKDLSDQMTQLVAQYQIGTSRS